ncbi:MAG TPA: hypothetical protein VH813_06405 [Candidatus Limnocylindrales bacterium]
MAKRTRGSTRPGRRAPLQRDRRPPHVEEPTERPIRPSTGLTQAEEARAAEIEASIVAEEKQADQVAQRSRERTRGPLAGVGREMSPLSVRAAAEYAYVRRDVLRIARIGGALLVVLAVLHVLINVAHVIRL